MASSSVAPPRTSKAEKEKKKADDREAARERSIKGWEVVRALEKKQSAFSWWPGQESEVYHTQTR
eukprot:7868015-Prorocentrum_lima.AAC.1